MALPSMSRPVGRPRKQPHECVCGYTTRDVSNFKRHKANFCRHSQDTDMVAELRRQLADTRNDLAETRKELAEARKQIFTLAKQPTRIDKLDININVFGNEKIDHISSQQIQNLLRNPESAVSEFIKLKYHVKENRNVICPNKKMNLYKVLNLGVDGTPAWESKDKQDILEKMYDVNSGHLECEADEDTREGSRFLSYQDKVKESEHGDKKLYQKHLRRIDCVIMDLSN